MLPGACRHPSLLRLAVVSATKTPGAARVPWVLPASSMTTIRSSSASSAGPSRPSATVIPLVGSPRPDHERIHIRFPLAPSPSSSPPPPPATDAAATPSSSSHGVAVLLGWLGASERHLLKYAGVHEQLGMTTASTICPIDTLLGVTRSELRPYAQRLLATLASQLTEPGGLLQQAPPAAGARLPPLVLHALSNGGAFVLLELDAIKKELTRRAASELSAVEQAQLAVLNNVRLVIFDCAPCYLHVNAGADAFTLGLGYPRTSLMRYAMRPVVFVFGLVQYLMTGFSGPAYFQAMRDLWLGQRELYIYSDGDHVCDVPALEDLIADKRRRHPSAIDAEHLPGAPHIQLLLAQPDKYTAAVTRSVRASL